MNDAKPPQHLTPETQEWVSDLDALYGLAEDPAAWRVLVVAAEAWDRLQAARAQVDAEGLTVDDRFGQPRPHPCLAVERDARVAFLRATRELGLEGVTDPDDVRPPRIGGR